MHRSIQFFPFALFLTSFVIIFITLLSPTAIFKEQVSLFKLSGNVTLSSIGSKAGAASLNLATISTIPGGNIERKRASLSTMVKKMRNLDNLSTNSSVISNKPSSIVSTSLYIGLMGKSSSKARKFSSSLNLRTFHLGACYRIPSSTNQSITTLNCTAASVTPMFTPLFETLSLPLVLQNALPNQFPLAPAVISLSVILLLMTSLIHLIVVLMPITNKTRVDQQIALRKNGIILGSISLVIGLIGSLALRVELSKFTNAFNVAALKLGGDLLFSQAALGNGFIRKSSFEIFLDFEQRAELFYA